MDSNDRLSIKQLLFTKAIPNYVIPIPTAGHKTYPCIDCGDRFLFQSSYEYHINRESVVITYMCRHCNQVKKFSNRCKLLSHIRSHAFKTATINVSDLKVDPLPASYFDNLVLKLADAAKHANVAKQSSADTSNREVTNLQQENPVANAKWVKLCLECNKGVVFSSQIEKDRAKHFMQYTNKVHTCPVCLFTLPTNCGLKAHLRLHSGNGPFFCPECGIFLTEKMMQYPYNHDCEGFRMMRATARYRCPAARCFLFHPNEYKKHMKANHIKKVYKCPICVVACFSEATITKHLSGHPTAAKAIIFFQCEMCPGRLVLQNQMENHLRGHITNSAFEYPCWACGQVYRDVRYLIQHYSDNHSQSPKGLPVENTLASSTESNQAQTQPEKSSLIYRVVKKCDKCKRSFTYKCKYEQISILPNECPFKCTVSKDTQSPQVMMQEETRTSSHSGTPGGKIKCQLCGKEISENWEEIKAHYANDHKNYRCLDAKLVLRKVDVKKYRRKIRRAARKKIKDALKKPRSDKNTRVQSTADQLQQIPSTSFSSNPFACKKCGYEGSTDKKMLEDHLITHRNLYMSYQCMECGQCFAVKRSFGTHLLVEHGISDADEYINAKECHNADALLKNNVPMDNLEVREPLRENQCQICRDQFEDADNLEKHFRTHGMAFLMKNSSNKSNSP